MTASVSSTMNVHGTSGFDGGLGDRGADERDVAMHVRVLHDAVTLSHFLADRAADLPLLVRR